MARDREYWRRRIFTHVFVWFNYWVTILDSIVGILTLGFYNPMLSFKAIVWTSKIEMNWQLKKGKK